MRKLQEKLSSIFSIKHNVHMEENFADFFWRGISSKDFIQEGHVLASAFQFDETDRTDNYKEASINWDDDVNALNKLLEQQKANGNLQFVGGATKLELYKVKMLLKYFIDSGKFSYERKPVEGNNYHGNLLVASTLDKQLKAQITNGLALIADTNIITRD